jgi:hypothetical protein
MDGDDDLAQLRDQAQDTIADNAVSLGAVPSTEAALSAPSGDQPSQPLPAVPAASEGGAAPTGGADNTVSQGAVPSTTAASGVPSGGQPSQPSPTESAVPGGGETSTGDPSGQGSFQIALGPLAKAGVKTAMHATGADQAFDRTIGGITGGTFQPGDIKALEDRALTAAKPGDLAILYGIADGLPVVLNSAQKASIDGLMGKLGSDALATRARAAYQKAVDAGQIRVQ